MTDLKIPGEVVSGPEGIQTTAIGLLSHLVLLCSTVPSKCNVALIHAAQVQRCTHLRVSICLH